MITLEFYNGLPLKYESFLLEKYDSFITTCRYIEVYYPTHDINYILVNKDGTLIELLVFGNKGKTSTCFNSLTDIDQDIIKAFTKKLFENFHSIKKIEIIDSYRIYDLKKSFLSEYFFKFNYF